MAVGCCAAVSNPDPPIVDWCCDVAAVAVAVAVAAAVAAPVDVAVAAGGPPVVAPVVLAWLWRSSLLPMHWTIVRPWRLWWSFGPLPLPEPAVDLLPVFCCLLSVALPVAHSIVFPTPLFVLPSFAVAPPPSFLVPP